MQRADAGCDNRRSHATIQHPTVRLYWLDDHCFEAAARIVAVSEHALALDQTCFYPGGGGQPADEGWLLLANGAMLTVGDAFADPDGVIWHRLTASPLVSLGEWVTLRLNRERRLTLMRHHTALHVLNTITLRDYGGWITGVQIGTAYSRIDFTVAGFSPALCADLEVKVNAVLAENHAVQAYFIPEDEFRCRDDLRRTLDAKPPIVGGRVRVVEIIGFDVQACGGTHVGTTAEVGHFSIARTENKGKLNKRLYIHLAPSSALT